jgi:hypothetical protein
MLQLALVPPLSSLKGFAAPEVEAGVMKILLFCDVNLSKNLSKFIPKVVVILK